MPDNLSSFKHPRYNLLTAGTSSTKLNHESPDGDWAIAGLHLAPANEAGEGTVCPWSATCEAVCLNTAGRGKMQSVQDARIRRTRQLFAESRDFVERVEWDIAKFVKAATRQGYQAAVRLNMTSDIAWWLPRYQDRGSNIIQRWHQQVQFYDYTKRPVEGWPSHDAAPFYDLTFSHDPGNPVGRTKKALNEGHNVSVVFDVKKSDELPWEWEGHEVIDGRKHDYRFLDRKGSKVIGLSALGDAPGSEFAVAA